MATEDNEYFKDILENLNRYQDCHGQIISSKKLKETLLRVMDEEEEEIARVDDINDSKEGVDDIKETKEGVDDRNDSAKQVGVTNDSEKVVVDGAIQRANQVLFTIASSSKTRSRASCGSPTFVAATAYPTRTRNQDIFSSSDSSTARRGRKSNPFNTSIGLLPVYTTDKLNSVIVPATRV